MKLLYVGTEKLQDAISEALCRTRGRHDVVVARSKEQFLALLQPGAVDILLFDYCAAPADLPLSQVLIYARAFKAPVLTLSSLAAETPVDDLQSAGINGYLFREHLSQLPFLINDKVDNLQLEQDMQEVYQALERTGNYYQTLLKCMHEFVFLFDEKGELVYLSPSAHQLTGFSDVDGHKLFEYIHEDDRRQFFYLFKKVLKKPDNRVEVHLRIRHKAGHYIWIEGGVTNLVQNDAIEAYVLSCRDVTDRTEMEQELLGINRLYACIRQFNRAILSADDERKLFGNLCYTATEFGNFKMAYISQFEGNGNRLRLIQSSGVAEQDVDPQMVLSSLEQTPYQQVLQTGQCFVCNDIEEEMPGEYWRYVARQKGFSSMIIIPLSKQGRIVGVFVLAATDKQAFHIKAIELLEEAADDISLKLQTIQKSTVQHLNGLKPAQQQHWA
ncbi:MAG: GAF domain-containing protein [Bacteroidetes bacterium]|nr:GAF domain-containing protein [Bacteroidota bacterium]